MSLENQDSTKTPSKVPEGVTWGIPPGCVPLTPPGWAPSLDPEYAAEQERWAAARRNPGSDPEVEAIGRAMRAVHRARGRHTIRIVLRPRSAPLRRAQGRARRAPARRAAATSSGGDADGDGPSDPPHTERPYVARASVAPLLVSDAPAMSDVLRAALSISSRQLRDLVERHGIRHSRRHAGARHIVVLVADVLTALGLAPAPEARPPEPPEPDVWDELAAVTSAATGHESGRPARAAQGVAS